MNRWGNLAVIGLTLLSAASITICAQEAYADECDTPDASLVAQASPSTSQEALSSIEGLWHSVSSAYMPHYYSYIHDGVIESYSPANGKPWGTFARKYTHTITSVVRTSLSGRDGWSISYNDSTLSGSYYFLTDSKPDMLESHYSSGSGFSAGGSLVPAGRGKSDYLQSGADLVAMIRMYNPNSGEHFYTSSWDERGSLLSAGWDQEGVGWAAPETSNTPVYRMYNPVAGEHHYTPNAEERDGLLAAGWNDEGVGWYSDDGQTAPLYREYNPNAFSNNHNYTADWSEHEYLISIGWQDEGIAWYGL